jgi:IclR family acetate operon transcriptional repressor
MADVAPSTVKSAMRTLDILEFLVRQRRPLAAHEIATALAIPVSSLAYLLSTLCERGYLERSGRNYGPGPALAKLHPLSMEPTLAERVDPLVRTLRIQLNETAGFFVRRGFEIEALASEIGLHALRYTLEIGQRAPLHSFAAGKALLATMQPAELDEYLIAAPRDEFTPRTLAEADTLRAEIVAIRKSGIARTQEEHAPGIIGIGRAAIDHDGVALGAFSVAIPITRFDADVEARATKLLIRSAELLAASSAAGTDPAA